VRIVVTERVPVAAVADGADGFALLDADGHVLQTSPTPPSGFVLIDGVPAPGAAGSVLDPSAADGLRIGAAIPTSLVPKIASVAATPAGVDLRIAQGGVAHLGDASDLDAKFVAVATILADADPSNLCTVDVRVPSAPSLTRGAPCL
jgi:cell division septal protein FtsQ